MSITSKMIKKIFSLTIPAYFTLRHPEFCQLYKRPLFIFLCARVRYDGKMKISRTSLGRFILVLCLIAASQLSFRPKDASPREATGPVAGTDSRPDKNDTFMPDQKTSTHDRLIEDLMHAIDSVQPLLDRYGYPLVFVAVLVEGFGLVAPGQTILMAASSPPPGVISILSGCCS